jgi:surface-anchored protein
LPQHAHHDEDEEEGDHDHDHTTPFLGIGAEELVSGLFVNDQITLSLVSVIGPGQFSLWQVDTFGEPTAFMSSADPDAQTDLILNAGLHSHFNWGFTEEGVYEITLMASGQLTGGSMVSDTATYTFNVVPEPATLLLLAAGSIGLLQCQKQA